MNDAPTMNSETMTTSTNSDVLVPYIGRASGNDVRKKLIGRHKKRKKEHGKAKRK